MPRAFDPTYYKTLTPRDTGETTNIAEFHYDATIQLDLYNSPNTFSSDFTVFIHRGYLFSPTAETLTMNLESDDIGFVWVGTKAYNGWARENADLISNSAGPGNPFTFDIAAGEYKAFRLLYANAQENSGLKFSITRADGSTFLDSHTGKTEYAITAGCDADVVFAPPFADWGSEADILQTKL
jgi:hypothetical protein